MKCLLMERLRSGATVERKKLNQWFFNIKKFSEELLENLNFLDEWPNKVKVMQKNWIGKSFDVRLVFRSKTLKLFRKLDVLLQDQILYLILIFSIISRPSISKTLRK